MTRRCDARTGAGDQCSREARWINPEKGFVYCAQHAKDYPTPLRKGTNRIRANLIPLVEDKA